MHLLMMTGVDTAVSQRPLTNPNNFLVESQEGKDPSCTSSANCMCDASALHSLCSSPTSLPSNEGEFYPSPSHSDLRISSSRMASLGKQPPSSLPWVGQGARQCCWNSSEYLMAVWEDGAGPAGAALMEQVQVEEGTNGAMIKRRAELSWKKAVFC